MSMGRHRCDYIPGDADIAWNRYFKPTLTIGTDDGNTPFHFDKRIDFCPWCGENLIYAYDRWRRDESEKMQL